MHGQTKCASNRQKHNKWKLRELSQDCLEEASKFETLHSRS